MKNSYWGDSEKPELPKEGGQPKGEFIFKEPNYVQSVDNHIYFYGDISREPILQLNKELHRLNNELIYSAKIQDREPANLFLHINTYGGGIFYGLAGMDAILRCKVSVNTIVDGCCASAGTFLSVVGKKRLISEHSFMLIHQLTAATWGKFRELQDDNINFIKLMDTIKDIYTKYTQVPTSKIDEILDHDLWFDAKTCLSYGLVDEIF